MVVNTDKTLNGKVLGYEIISNGYKLFQDGIAFISQLEPYANLFVANGSYEENALAHIEDMISSAESEKSLIEEVESLKALVDEQREEIALLNDTLLEIIM